MADQNSNLSGVEKAAIFLMTLGEANAAQIIKHLGPREVQKIGTAMAAMQNVSRDMVKTSVAEFVVGMQRQTPLGIGNDDYIRKVLTDALGDEKAKSMIDRILIGGSTTHDAAPSQLANLRAEWTSDRSYSERIGNLQGTAITGTPLNNETYLRNTPTDTLLDDNAVDNLYGEDDLDWFIASLANDLLVDRIADELITDPTQS